MQYFSIDDVRIIEIEMTTRCNASCPMCGRFVEHGSAVLPGLPMVDQDHERLLRVLDPVLPRLDAIVLCGNYGDPIATAATGPFVHAIRERAPALALRMNTNGSARTPAWWSDLAGAFRTTGSHVTFSIDGLADTNHLYRRGTSFERIIANARAFIEAGGRARWDFIVFRHNEHQVEEARALAAGLGFEAFVVKKTGRFYSPRRNVDVPVYPVHALGDPTTTTHVIEEPTNPDYKSGTKSKIVRVLENYPTVKAYYDHTQIECKAQATGRLYVSAEGYVFPCAWLGHMKFSSVREEADGLRALLDRAGLGDVDCRQRSLEDIVSGETFKAIVDSWSKTSCADGKLAVCARYCGSEKFHTDRDTTHLR